MRLISVVLAALLFSGTAASAQTHEMFIGVYANGVDTPFTLDADESGVSIAAGLRFSRSEALRFIGKPSPYVLLSFNTKGKTSFGGMGLSWKLGKGKVYARPGIGLVVHDGPSFRFDRVSRSRVDLGSRVLFQPELAVGVQLNKRLSIEASWLHISHARLFNREQNPGVDLMGLRLNAVL
jgi:lipid A 3-O-deacylase